MSKDKQKRKLKYAVTEIRFICIVKKELQWTYKVSMKNSKLIILSAQFCYLSKLLTYNTWRDL